MIGITPPFSGKPSGWLKELYGMCSRYSHDPIGEIESLANSCLAEGIIDNKRYTVLQYRMPLPGSERETLERVGKRIGVSGERVRHIEGKLLRRMRNKIYKDGKLLEGIHFNENYCKISPEFKTPDPVPPMSYTIGRKPEQSVKQKVKQIQSR